MTKIILEVEALSKHYKLGGRVSTLFGQSNKISAVGNISFRLAQGEILGLVGESGSGKSTLGKSIIKLNTINHGKIKLLGNEIQKLSPSQFRSYRKHIQMIFQDLDAALNPNMKIKQIMEDALLAHFNFSKVELKEKLMKSLSMVHLSENILTRYPQELSGGQKRRVAIANVLAIEPQIIVADEPTTGLDNYTQYQIINLITNLQKSQGLSMLFISHDLSLIKNICHRVLVLYQGNIVEQAGINIISQRPGHPYSQLLWDSCPNQSAVTFQSTHTPSLTSGIDENYRPKKGCRFAPRCQQYIKQGRPDICVSYRNQPPLKCLSDEHSVACFFPLTE